VALRKILKQDDSLLHAQCKPVEVFDEKLNNLLDDMVETLKKADGVGLAAPQIGVCRRICVLDLEEEDGIIELINPVIVKKSGRHRDIEGCLSCPNIWGYVVRPNKCLIKAQNRKGKFFELEMKEMGARVACHEIDHLEGIIFTQFVDEYVDPDDFEDDGKGRRRRRRRRGRR